MKLLRRNKTEFEYLPFTGVETDVNEDGEHTGEFHPEYGTAVTYKGNISIPSGQTEHQFYGEDIRYTHTLLMDKPDVAIDEQGVIRWKDNLYDVKAVRRSLNSFSTALRQQTKSVEDPEPEPDPVTPDVPDEPGEPDEPANPDEPEVPETPGGDEP